MKNFKVGDLVELNELHNKFGNAYHKEIALVYEILPSFPDREPTMVIQFFRDNIFYTGYMKDYLHCK